MAATANAYAAYRSAEVEGLTQRDLLIKLYQGAERFLFQAQAAMRAKQSSDAHFGCVRAKAIFIELMSTLNFDLGGEVATQLRDLYVFLIATISEANLRKDPTKLESIMPVIATLRQGWEQVPDEFANTTALPAGEHRHSLDLRT
ncbi:MAG: flagellar export chaperone FliS [Planctomycetes bacterium]|nr:flagellar export chaperone FliS [Planctomycetota bacterium]